MILHCSEWIGLKWFNLIKKSIGKINPLTPTILLVILTVCHTVLEMLVLEFGIGSTYNPLIHIFLYSHHLSGCYCIDFVRRNYVLVAHGSLRVKVQKGNVNNGTNEILLN